MSHENRPAKGEQRERRIRLIVTCALALCLTSISTFCLAQEEKLASGPQEFRVIERTYSPMGGGLTVALANVENRVSHEDRELNEGRSVEANKQKMLEVIDTLKEYGVNMILFPEFSLTGYFWDDPKWDKRSSPFSPTGDPACWKYMEMGAVDHAKRWLKKVKSKLDANLKYVIFTSVRKNPKNPTAPAGPSNRFLNSTFVVDRDFNCEDVSQNEGSHIYDKTFLPGIEKVYLESGRSDYLVIESEWGRLGFGICYDLCFSQLFQEYAMVHKVDGVIVTASWRGTAEREYANLNVRTDQYYGFLWDLMASARAATNQIWMITCNAVGRQARGDYRFWGGSGVWAPSGVPLVEASRVEQELLLIRGLDLRGEIRKEHDDFWYYQDFTEIYRPMANHRNFTRVR